MFINDLEIFIVFQRMKLIIETLKCDDKTTLLELEIWWWPSNDIQKLLINIFLWIINIFLSHFDFRMIDDSFRVYHVVGINQCVNVFREDYQRAVTDNRGIINKIVQPSNFINYPIRNYPLRIISIVLWFSNDSLWILRFIDDLLWIVNVLLNAIFSIVKWSLSFKDGSLMNVFDCFGYPVWLHLD